MSGGISGISLKKYPGGNVMMKAIVPLTLLCLLVSCAGPASFPSETAKAIHEAAQTGNADEVKAILSEDPAMIEARDPLYGDTPLHSAAYSGQAEMVKFLISLGAPIHARDTIGAAPLHWAAMANRKEAAQMLINAGADVNARTYQGKTPLRIAREYQSRDVEEILRKNSAMESVQ
jgi:ankyrin repeat protein